MARNIYIDLKARTSQYERSIGRATAATQGLDKSLGNFITKGAKRGAAGIAAGVTAIGVAAVGVGVKAATAFSGFEQSLSKMEGLVGVAHEQVLEFADGIKTLSVESARGPQELADAMFFITSAGLEGAEAMQALEVSAKAAAAGLGETETIADVVTSAMNAYGDSLGGATVATDVLVATVREGKAAAPELAASLGRVIPIASAMGVEFDEVGAAIAAMTRTGLDAAEAGTALRSILNSLLAPGSAAKQVMSDLGLSAAGLRTELADKGLFATLEHLTQAFEGQDEATATVFGNVRALTGIMSLMGANADATRGIFDSLADSTGALDTAFGVAADTGAFAFEQAKARIETALLDVGETILPMVADALDDIMPMIPDVVSALGDLSIAMVNLGVEAVPYIVDGFYEAELAMNKVQVAFLRTKREVEGFNNVADVLTGPWKNIPDAFNDADAAALAWLETQQRVMRRMHDGASGTSAAQMAMVELADANLVSAESLRMVQEQAKLTDTEMLSLIGTGTYLRNAWGLTEEQVRALSAALDEQKETARGDLISSLRDVGGANEYLGSSASRAATGIGEEADAIDGDIIPNLSELETALTGAAAAQESLSDVMLAATSPAFKAIKAVESMEKAQAALDEELGKAEQDVGAVAAAQAALVQETIKAQSALDGVSGTSLEATVEAVQRVLGGTEEEAFNLLETLGLLDGYDVAMVVEFKTRVTGPMAGALSSGRIGGVELSSGTLAFGSGGVVPGPVGAPQLAVVHGGEEVLTAAERTLRPSGASTSNNINLTFHVASERTVGDIQTALVVAGVTDLVDLGRAAM